MKTKWYDCICLRAEHALRFVIDEEDGDVWTEVNLTNYRNFFKRCWVALKYIFGYQSKYGAFDCWELDEKDLNSLIDLLTEVKKLKSKD
jgi:hypothetical protein